MALFNAPFCDTGSFSHCCTLYRFYSQKFCGFSFPFWNLDCAVCITSLCSPGLSAHECSTTGPPTATSPPQSTSFCLTPLVRQLPPCCTSSLPWLWISVPPISLDECFFFNSLVVRFSYSSIWEHFWGFIVFNWLLSFVSFARKQYCLPTPLVWPGRTSSLFPVKP